MRSELSHLESLFDFTDRSIRVFALPCLLLAFSAEVCGAVFQQLNWEEGRGFRSAAIQPSPGAGAGFTLLPASSTGISFSNRLENISIAANRLLEIGSGVALGDVDGDGLVDIYFCGLETGNVLYRNLGDWKFKDITGEAGIACRGQRSTGCVFADLDGDGDLDLLVTSLGGGTRLFRNDGRGHFEEDKESGLIPSLGATSIALGDVDGDGDLDLYITNYRTDTFLDQPAGLRPEMRQQADGSWALEPRTRFLTIPLGDAPPLVLERGEPDVLYINKGGGKFVPVPWESGVFNTPAGEPLRGPYTDWGLSVMFRDLNGDGLPDLYVCNDFIRWPDRVWFNDRGRRFKLAAPTAVRSFSVASMAVDVADINRDGIADIFTVDMLSRSRVSRARQRPDLLNGKVAWPKQDPDFSPEVARNTLQLGRGDGTFADIAIVAGVAATDWTTSAIFLDVDLDGWEDLLIGAGNLHDVQDADALAAQGGQGRKTRETRIAEISKLPPRLAPSLAFRNKRDLTFEETGKLWGFNQSGATHGFALADLDNDGDLDLVMNSMNESARVYQNNAQAPRIEVRLRGLKQNGRGAGARIEVRGGPVTQTQEILVGGRYLSGDDPVRTFATGNASQLEIEVTWRNGNKSLVRPAFPNRIYEILEAGSSPAPLEQKKEAAAWFVDLTENLNHSHTDQLFDDFARNPLLPHKLSTPGPGLAWMDWNEDGHEDLVVGGGTGGELSILLGDGKGHFSPLTKPGSQTPNPRDQTAILPSWDQAGKPVVLVAESTWETNEAEVPLFRTASPSGSGLAWSDSKLTTRGVVPGSMAQADLHGTGKLDLFVSGRTRTGRYPESGTSWLLRNGPGGYEVQQVFTNLGLVSACVFTDLNGDDKPDLVVATEWGTPRILINHDGALIDETASWGLDGMEGWWNGVAVADFDEDGRMDLAFSNWGQNWRLDQPDTNEASPVLLYFGDFVGDAMLQTVLASKDRQLGKITPWRERKALVSSVPFIGLKFPDHRSFSLASMDDLLVDAASPAKILKAGFFSSVVLLNRGNRFERKELPVQAQFAPGFGISAGDFNGDGHEDLFLAQNFFGTDQETSRQDAGSGLLLLGNGKGGFDAVAPGKSGIRISGEQRGTSVGDFDGDGRPDIAVGQNSGTTRLFSNKGALPGIRVRLKGRIGNPAGVGAKTRLSYQGREGAIREIQSGSGWLSANSMIQVLGGAKEAKAVVVRWPGGKTTRTEISSGSSLVEVSEP